MFNLLPLNGEKRDKGCPLEDFSTRASPFRKSFRSTLAATASGEESLESPLLSLDLDDVAEPMEESLPFLDSPYKWGITFTHAVQHLDVVVVSNNTGHS